MNLQGKIAIITGASHGLGRELVKHYLQAGASVVMCARGEKDLENTRQYLSRYLVNNARLLAIRADVSVQQDVVELVNLTIEEFGRVDILIANAGIYGAKGAIDSVDWDAWIQTIDINLKGTVLQCREVVPSMKNQKSGKIIIISGGGATKPLPNLSAYSASKAGVVRFAETLALELKSYNIDVNSVAPGALNTRFLDEVLQAGAEVVGNEFYAQAIKQKESGGAPLDFAAELCVFLGSDKSNGISGRLISAVWDPWQSLVDVSEELVDSDIYTLRRITPEDRGKVWSEN